MAGRWLVTGAGGMLGRDLQQVLAGREVTALTREQLDITDPAAVRDAVAGHHVVVNAAAWTDVDGAESHEAEAARVNGLGPSVLAGACASVHAWLVQVSTDYVFSGEAETPYDELAPMQPQSAYGRGKAEGEDAVRRLVPASSYIVRTAWLYGEHGANFVRTMARLASERETVDVVDDQRGQPTWSRDVAEAIVGLVDNGAPAGIYHATSAGETTWFGLARAVFEELGADAGRVRPTTTDRFPRPARRPSYSVLGHGGWAKAGLAPIGDWRGRLRVAFPTVVRA